MSQANNTRIADTSIISSSNILLSTPDGLVFTALEAVVVVVVDTESAIDYCDVMCGVDMMDEDEVNFN